MDDKKQREQDAPRTERLVACMAADLTEPSEEAISNLPMPDIRAGGARKIDLVQEYGVRLKRKKRSLVPHERLLEDIEADIECASPVPEKQAPPVDIRAEYKKCSTGTIRREWADKAEKGELTGSGMPSYISKIVEGEEEEYEREMLKFCKLAGLRYKTSKQKLKKEVERIKADMRSAVEDMEARLDKLVDSFKQLEEF